MELDKWVYDFRWQILLLLLGFIFVGGGILASRTGTTSSQVEILSESDSNFSDNDIIVEITGSVEKPGVYELPVGSRVEDLLVAAGGVSANADRGWMDKTLNRAGKLTDGQKIYIPDFSEEVNTSVSSASSSININSASQSQLESLWGIGPVTAQNIIDNRPYSSVDELLAKKIIKQNVYDRNKEKISVY